ncbi:hypothetical protein GQ44DRAFT_24594 [Phaeosphaeriaceae sp. PMI808]|nr:hypothetical protein GQ44DRAFT_24594 [Phaeosphaeriaceae sp. PMI808]
MYAMDAEIKNALHQLKVERDTWQAVALQYKSAFGAQTNRLEQLRDICFATQADLENERAQHRRRDTTSDQRRISCSATLDAAEYSPNSCGTAFMFFYNKINQPHLSNDYNNPLFLNVRNSVDQLNYGNALAELERLLRGPLSPKARAEGLLLKSCILQAAGPDELYEALAACSEAMELCNRLADLESFLPRIQYQRSMLDQARDAFNALSHNHMISSDAIDYRSSSDDAIRLRNNPDRRSAFDENRTFDQGILVHLDEKLEVAYDRFTPGHVRCTYHT